MTRQVTLAELRKCEREYRKVKPVGMADVNAWKRDYTSLKIAILHAKSGKSVFVQEDFSKEGDIVHYLLSDGSEKLPATVCSNHLAREMGHEEVKAE